MASVVVDLIPSERLREDGRAIDEICERFGPDAAARLLSGAIEELARTVGHIAAQVRLPDAATLHWQSRRLQKLALGLGLISLANVAGDLRQCHADPTAFAAVRARLQRIAGNSLSGLPKEWVNAH